jgi:antitoxin HigA-1
MRISTKSEAVRFLEKLNAGPLTFGQMIESIRLCDEISQVDLAKKMKISRAHLCDIEKGRRTVSAERAAQFARVLGYSVNQFVATALEDQLRKAGLNVRVRLDAA